MLEIKIGTGDSMDEVEVSCPVCRKTHIVSKKSDMFFCRNEMLALVNDRHGWRLMRITPITEKQDIELDRLWGSEDER